MKNDSSSTSSFNGLVVILVVVALVAVLAGMLLPALSKAKAKAHRASRRMPLDLDYVVAPQPYFNTESYAAIAENDFRDARSNPLSTFGLDVDTASYSNIRRFLQRGHLPDHGAVRIEEMLNYFPYAYAPPSNAAPFALHAEVAGCPWEPEHRLLRLGLKGREVRLEQRPPCNLVFLIDVSGSMKQDNKLPLVQASLELLVQQLTGTDRVAIVVYAGNSRLVLDSTTGDRKRRILNAIRRLRAGGSTNGGQGIQQAYATAVRNFITGGINRVILCTDGDFNVGTTSSSELARLIVRQRQTGVFLSVLGFGMGNYKDDILEQLADLGNGNYGYIDTRAEAKKLFVEQVQSTLVTIAKDVKIQVEFNPAQVGVYRLIGYENRLLRKEDFNDDLKDAGDLGSGHTVTALYEIVRAGTPLALPKVDPPKYQKPAAHELRASADLCTVKLRYKDPQAETSQRLVFIVQDPGTSLDQASGDFKFAAAVASFGMMLRESPHRGQSSIRQVLELAQAGIGEDQTGYRKEFMSLVKQAQSLLRAESVARR